MVVALQTAQSVRRARRLKRRFSSPSITSPWKPNVQFLSPQLSSNTQGRIRPASSSPATSAAAYFPYTTDPFNLSEDSPAEEAAALNNNLGLFSLRDEERLESRPRIYASLPPTPIHVSSPSRPSTPSPASLPPIEEPPLSRFAPPVPFSLWDYLREELLATDFDSHQELKWERVSNFLSIPLAIEKVRCPNRRTDSQ
jgi:hypothetical protein